MLQSDWFALYAATATTLVLALDQALHQTRGAGYARLTLHTLSTVVTAITTQSSSQFRVETVQAGEELVKALTYRCSCDY